VFELAAPVVQRERSLRADSGGAGRWRGGHGQTSSMTLKAGEQEWRVSALADRTTVPAPGADEGHDGALGEVSVDGEPLPTKRLTSLRRDAHVRLDLPGGGGVGDPRERDPQAVLADVVDGYITIAAAKERYGVTIRQLRDSRVLLPEDFEIQEEA
jgi:N-methylhydantoinase B